MLVVSFILGGFKGLLISLLFLGIIYAVMNVIDFSSHFSETLSDNRYSQCRHSKSTSLLHPRDENWGLLHNKLRKILNKMCISESSCDPTCSAESHKN
jgi:hypothetical protein